MESASSYSLQGVIQASGGKYQHNARHWSEFQHEEVTFHSRGGLCLDIHLRQHMALSATASVVATPVLILRRLGSNQARANSRGLLFKAFAPIRSARGSCVPV